MNCLSWWLKPLSNNSFTVKDSFSLITDILSFNQVPYNMASFDVKSLFTNIPLQETIDIYLDKLFHNVIK